jgi:Na+/H+-dicarboxylate symporter
MGSGKKPGLSAQIMIGMFLGLVAGIFFGEYCAFLEIIGNAFIKLLQMTILPYITVSLILGIGGLTFEQAKLLAKKAGLLLLLFWGISLAMVLLLPLSFPHWESAAFFSTSSVQPPKPVDFLSLYIPSNPFYSLANNIVPAVVLFSIMVGIALMGMQNKDTLLQALDTASQALIRMTNIIVKLTPIGVFAITAAAAGTMTIDEFGRLQVYIVSYNIAAIFLTFWILPMLVAPLTPFKYRDIIGLTRDALVTAFTTGNLFIVLTVLTECCKQLFEKYDLKKEKTDTYVDVIVPISFNFPNAGKLLMLLFILFAAWFTGGPLTLTQYPSFVFSGLLSFFGGVDVAMPFMLDLLHMPSDLYQLYVVTGVINGRFATLLAAMNLVIFTLLATASLTGVMTVSKKKLVNYVIVSLLLTGGLIVGTRAYFAIAVKNTYTRDQVIANMQSLVFPVSRQVYKSAAEVKKPADFNLPVLQRIRKSGVLRVGYSPDSLPFTYFSETGELIGLDVDMAQLLARELNVKLEFVPFIRDKMAEQLASELFDVIMSGVVITTPRLEKMTFSAPYMEATLAFIVRDYRRTAFATNEAVQSMPHLKIGIPRVLGDYLFKKIQAYLPNAQIIELDSMRLFLESNPYQLDAVVLDAERGSAWTLLYPRFKAVVPLPNISKIPLAYPVAGRDAQFAKFLSQWIRLKKDSGEFKQLYEHWILGLDAEPRQPRWSVIRDVFKWVD